MVIFSFCKAITVIFKVTLPSNPLLGLKCKLNLHLDGQKILIFHNSEKKTEYFSCEGDIGVPWCDGPAEGSDPSGGFQRSGRAARRTTPVVP